MKSSKFTGKMEEIKAKWTQVSLKNVLKVKDPKLSRVLIVQNNVYTAVHGAIGEDKLQETCKKMLTLSYLRTPVRKKLRNTALCGSGKWLLVKTDR